ncbi:MAG: molecular chaperone HtpG [Clostridia bacterium]|nr:molecular chaperone HtpG [Clostridia bacterium]
MSEQKGKISINAQDIMPIIKRWLYSDKDIFVRELVSNASDANTKHTRLVQFGTAPAAAEEYKISVEVDPADGTIAFIDNGIGMTAEEVEKYINQVAFSGAQDFVERYKDKDAKDEIIGHFGLGFYSAFMVAEKVTINTLSWQEGAAPVLWESEDGMDFTMSQGTRTARGTTITLKISEDEKEFLSYEKINSILVKYCLFIAAPLFSVNCAVEGEGRERRINETAPLWMKAPKDCTDEEYKSFYHKLFSDFDDPLFYVHLNADYPFNLKGILYFPKYREGAASMEGQVKMFCGQVFVADNISEVIPEFLLLLKGVVDCPDIPLNVSRSFLQNDQYVKQLSAYITRKVADKINSIMKNDREQYEKYWRSISPFVKYCCMKDEKFYDKVKGSLLFEKTDGVMLTLEQLKEQSAQSEDKVYYTTDPKSQSGAVKLFTDKGKPVTVFETVIDINFISFLEHTDGTLKFLRVDAATDALGEEGDNSEINLEHLGKLFVSALGDESVKVTAQKFDDPSVHAVMQSDEQMRRYGDMAKLYGQNFALPQDRTLVLNSASPLVKWLSAADENDEKTKLVCNHIADLATLMTQPLDADRMAQFIARSGKLLADSLS